MQVVDSNIGIMLAVVAKLHPCLHTKCFTEYVLETEERRWQSITIIKFSMSLFYNTVYHGKKKKKNIFSSLSNILWIPHWIYSKSLFFIFLNEIYLHLIVPNICISAMFKLKKVTKSLHLYFL